jgi:hypothetical protein
VCSSELAEVKEEAVEEEKQSRMATTKADCSPAVLALSPCPRALLVCRKCAMYARAQGGTDSTHWCATVTLLVRHAAGSEGD